jgi:uncharacterized membrane protein YkvA (DUF1232 family)
MPFLPLLFSQNKKTADSDAQKPVYQESWLYQLLVKSAYRLIQKPLAILDLVKKAFAYLGKFDNIKELGAEVRHKTEVLSRLLSAYAKGEYREVSLKNLAFSAAALLYLISPFDLLPDFLPLGLFDDLAILTWVYENFQTEIEAFLQWEDRQKMKLELPKDDERQ